MIFASDNWAGAPPEIIEAIGREGAVTSAAYGSSETDDRARSLLRDLFERDAEFYFVGTGTAANSIGLAGYSKPGGLVLCHSESHISVDECGSVGFQGDGMRLQPVLGADGRIDPADLSRKIDAIEAARVSIGQACAVSITQATEAGTVYSLDAINAISRIAAYHDLPVHMDGARFANAISKLGVTPAEMTWKSGIDMLSFGATKNGCIAAEVLIVFDRERAKDVEFRQMRSGHLASKSRFMAAQLVTYLQDGFWLELASHANAMADRLRRAIETSNRARLAWPTDVNEVFVIIDSTLLANLQSKGLVCGPWNEPAIFNDNVGSDETLIRLVTSFATDPTDVDTFSKLLAHQEL